MMKAIAQVQDQMSVLHEDLAGVISASIPKGPLAVRLSGI